MCSVTILPLESNLKSIKEMKQTCENTSTGILCDREF
jgi:hypothetical protein